MSEVEVCTSESIDDSPIFSGSDTEMFISKESPPSSSSIYRKQQSNKNSNNQRQEHFLHICYLALCNHSHQGNLNANATK